MIEKMKFLSITGPKTDIDRVVNTYLSRYEIHLENALSELTTVENLSPFLEINPYREALNTINGFYEELEDPEKISPDRLEAGRSTLHCPPCKRRNTGVGRYKSSPGRRV